MLGTAVLRATVVGTAVLEAANKQQQSRFLSDSGYDTFQAVDTWASTMLRHHVHLSWQLVYSSTNEQEVRHRRDLPEASHRSALPGQQHTWVALRPKCAPTTCRAPPASSATRALNNGHIRGGAFSSRHYLFSLQKAL